MHEDFLKEEGFNLSQMEGFEDVDAGFTNEVPVERKGLSGEPETETPVTTSAKPGGEATRKPGRPRKKDVPTGTAGAGDSESERTDSTIRVGVYMNGPLYDRLKVVSYVRRMNMSEYIRACVSRAVEEDGKKMPEVQRILDVLQRKP